MLHEHPDQLRQLAARDESRLERAAVGRFVGAVLALSDDPRPENVERYLAASRALEDSRSGRKPRPSRAA